MAHRERDGWPDVPAVVSGRARCQHGCGAGILLRPHMVIGLISWDRSDVVHEKFCGGAITPPSRIFACRCSDWHRAGRAGCLRAAVLGVNEGLVSTSSLRSR